LAIGDYFEKERARKEPKGCVVTDAKRRVETGGQDVTLIFNNE
jgi:hypothetical protein